MINKNKILFLLFTVMLFSSISCKKSDEIVQPPQPVELYSKDSISVSSSDTGWVMIGDSVSYVITDSTIKNIELKYYMESSGGVNGDRIYYGIFLSNPAVSLFSDYGYLYNSKIIDTTRSFNISNYKGLSLKAKVAIEKKIDFSSRYVKFKNIKLTKID